MRASVAKASLGIAAILLITSGFVLCACPGWPALGAGFAVVAACAGVGRTRIWALVWLVLCLLDVGLQIKAKAREQEIILRVERLRDANKLEQTNTAPK